MANVSAWLGSIPLLPLAAAIVITLFGRQLREKSHWPCWLAIAASLVLSGLVLAARPLGTESTLYSWMDFAHQGERDSRLVVPILFRADQLTAIMLVTVTGVGLLVAIFSAGYVHGERGYSRFFAEFSLFVFSMCGLVLASNFFLLYIFWEAVGLCSYLLIGFWYDRPAAAAAARKAFLVNRIGDFGFLLGILLLWTHFDFQLNFSDTIGDSAAIARLAAEHPAVLTTICLLLFCGAVGKSAQFPLHVWLPDAMEGPTPASALIHAATMVTAGVYMVARTMPLFLHSPFALGVVAGIGATTALLAALIALTQDDLKRVLAYSTLSQLGYMFLALGSAGADPALAQFAVFAAIFHLFTHAFFKALLFLSAGSVMHSMGNVIDMRRFGGLRHALPVTHWSFLAGAVALAALPVFSGFWSKDEILASLWFASKGVHGSYFTVLLWIGIGTALLTAFYTFRAYFRTFWGPERFPAEAGHHPHDAPLVMALPLVILSLFALGIGGVVGPLTHWFEHYLSGMAGLPESHEHAPASWLMMVGIAASVLGLLIAASMYARPSLLPVRLAERFPLLYQLSANRFYLDEVYQAFVVGPVTRLARGLVRADDQGLDATVDLLGNLPAGFARGLRLLQSGLVQSYALVSFVGLAALLVWLLGE